MFTERCRRYRPVPAGPRPSRHGANAYPDPADVCQLRSLSDVEHANLFTVSEAARNRRLEQALLQWGRVAPDRVLA